MRDTRERGGIHQPFYGTWVAAADFMLRQDAGKFMQRLGKYLGDLKFNGSESHVSSEKDISCDMLFNSTEHMTFLTRHITVL